MSEATDYLSLQDRFCGLFAALFRRRQLSANVNPLRIQAGGPDSVALIPMLPPKSATLSRLRARP